MSQDQLPPGFGANDPTAHDRAETEVAPVGFKISEHTPAPGEADSTPWIWVQVEPPGLEALKSGDAFLGFEFRPGVSFEEGKRLAHEMDRLLLSITCTKFIT